MLGAESAGAFTGPGIDYYMSFRGSRRGQKAYRRIYAPFVTKDQWIPWFNDWSHCWSMNRLIAVCFLSPLLQAAFSTKAIDFACSTRPAASKENAISLNAQWSVNVTGRQWSTLCSCFQTVGSAQWYSTRKIQYISLGATRGYVLQPRNLYLAEKQASPLSWLLWPRDFTAVLTFLQFAGCWPGSKDE